MPAYPISSPIAVEEPKEVVLAASDIDIGNVDVQSVVVPSTLYAGQKTVTTAVTIATICKVTPSC